ncbi:MAG: hypothetical protein JW810_01970 [Sedimentisphaerales bacterium]|nr:hypothetical protein [Sedimentisphaerales bacterium]
MMRKRDIRLLILFLVLSLPAVPADVLGDADTPASGPSKSRLLVVTPEKFQDALADYVRHKRQQMSVQVLCLETILKENENGGGDDPERLKRRLYAIWKRQQLHYVLLVGDADILPVRYMVLDRITPAAFDYAFYPSDLYYADLARPDGSFDDWNARQESYHAGYFGEVRGEKNKEDPINYDAIDYLPEIAVGRWPISTVGEVKTLSDKTIQYEKGILEGTKPNRHHIALVSVSGWVDSRQAMDEMSVNLSPEWIIEKRYFRDKQQAYQTPPPTAEQVVSLLNEGLGVVCHAGHGKDLLWEKSFALKHLEDLSNADRLPIVFSAACHTARFATLPPYEPYLDAEGHEHQGSDKGEVFTAPPPPPAPYQMGRYNPPSLGEALLRQGPNGAVAYIGCNTGSQPCALSLMEGFILGLQRERLGDCWNQAIAHYHQKERLSELKPTSGWYPPSVFFQGMKFMLLGDPSLLLPSAR